MRKILTARRKSQSKKWKVGRKKADNRENERERDSHDDTIFKAKKWQRLKVKWNQNGPLNLHNTFMHQLFILHTSLYDAASISFNLMSTFIVWLLLLLFMYMLTNLLLFLYIGKYHKYGIRKISSYRLRFRRLSRSIWFVWPKEYGWYTVRWI